MRLLLVDDELMVLDLLKERVRKIMPDAELHDFSNAKEALHFAKNNPIDIAFLDINMRVYDGVYMAKELIKQYPKINIIFCTGYSEYMQEAFDMYCSGYLLKPITVEKLKKALDHLRYPIIMEDYRVRFQCYGNFEVFCDGKPITFKYNRTKELLAYLVDRNGVDCSTLGIMAAMFGDEVRRSYFNHLRTDLIETFKHLGVENVIRVNRGYLGINKEAVSCDYYDYLAGKLTKVPEEYMSQYDFMW